MRRTGDYRNPIAGTEYGATKTQAKLLGILSTGELKAKIAVSSIHQLLQTKVPGIPVARNYASKGLLNTCYGSTTVVRVTSDYTRDSVTLSKFERINYRDDGRQASAH